MEKVSVSVKKPVVIAEVKVPKVIAASLQKGRDGVSVTKAEINSDGELVITFSDGNVLNLGRVVGKDAKIGPGLKLEGDVLSVDDVLNKFSEDDSGNLMYNGERIASVPSGGAEGQVLAKQSDDDYDYGWKNSVTLEYNSGVLSIF